jgi:hypothetical protein
LALNFGVPSNLNINQQNVANAVTGFFNRTGGIPLVFGALSPAGLTQIFGEAATGTQQTTFEAMTQFMGLMTDRSSPGVATACHLPAARRRSSTTALVPAPIRQPEKHARRANAMPMPRSTARHQSQPIRFRNAGAHGRPVMAQSDRSPLEFFGSRGERTKK